MSSSQNQPPNSNNTAPNPWSDALRTELSDYEFDSSWSSPDFYPYVQPDDVPPFGYEGQIDDGYVYDGIYNDNGEDDDGNEDDRSNLQWIAEQVCGTIDDEEIDSPNEDLSVFSDEVQKAFEQFSNQNNKNPVDDEDETMRQMLEAERYMQAEYYRANAPQHFRREQYTESKLNADAAEFQPRFATVPPAACVSDVTSEQ